MTNRPCRNVYEPEADEAPELTRKSIIDQDEAFIAAMQASGRKVTGPSSEPGTERARCMSRPDALLSEGMGDMKAISLWQPWASLWLSPAKVHETRHWPTRHRGPLLVHASKKLVEDPELSALLRKYELKTPLGVIVGQVNLIDCRRMALWNPEHEEDRACGDWSDERYAWQRSPEFVVFKTPIPWRGAQGLFDVPESALREAA